MKKSAFVKLKTGTSQVNLDTLARAETSSGKLKKYSQPEIR